MSGPPIAPPVGKFHSRTVLSPDPDAVRQPSGEKATDQTESVGLAKTPRSLLRLEIGERKSRAVDFDGASGANSSPGDLIRPAEVDVMNVIARDSRLRKQRTDTNELCIPHSSGEIFRAAISDLRPGLLGFGRKGGNSQPSYDAIFVLVRAVIFLCLYLTTLL